jgi:uncharacterized protein DUF3592
VKWPCYASNRQPDPRPAHILLIIAGGVALFETDIGEEREHTGSFMYLSIPYFALREYWLSRRSKQWLSVSATVESAHRSRGGYRETIRGELWYSYSLYGEEHSGRVVRDSAFSAGKIDVLTEEYEPGQNIIVRVNPRDPSQSYYPSGLGFVEPLIVGVISLGATVVFLIVILTVVGIVLSAITGR